MSLGRQRCMMPAAENSDNSGISDDTGNSRNNDRILYPRTTRQVRNNNRTTRQLRLASEPDRTPKWSAAGLGQPGLLVYLLLATAIASGETTMTSNSGSSSNYPNTNREYGDSGTHSRGLVASSTLCPPKCKCLPNKQVSSTVFGPP